MKIYKLTWELPKPLDLAASYPTMVGLYYKPYTNSNYFSTKEAALKKEEALKAAVEMLGNTYFINTSIYEIETED